MHKVKIFIATSVHQWDDVRILRKEALSLVRLYDVELHAPAPFDVKKFEGVQIYGLPAWKSVSDRRATRRELRNRIRKSNATIFHFHDPELIPLAIRVKLMYKKRVIYDIHEDNSAIILHKTWIPESIRRLAAAGFGILERFSCLFFDHLITSSPILHHYFNRFPSTLVSNYPRIEWGRGFPEKPKDPIAFVYVGCIGLIRGIKEVCEAYIKMLQESDIQTELHIAGAWRPSLPESFKREMEDIFSHSSVNYHGILSYEKAKELMRSCHVGLIPFLPYKGNMTISPHKLFDYMEAGLTILASDFSGWPQIIVEGRVGDLFDPTDPQSIIRAMSHAANSPLIREEQGRRAQKLVRTRFTWISQEKQLFKAYESVSLKNEF